MPSIPINHNLSLLQHMHKEQKTLIHLLIQKSVVMIDSLWTPKSHCKIISTYGYVYEILRRSKATLLVFQLALYYISSHQRTIQQRKITDRNPYIHCGRRMFLAAFIVAYKYLNDKSYKNKSWAEMAKLNVNEVNEIERVFLQLMDYKLHVSESTFKKWIQVLYGQHGTCCLPALVTGSKRKRTTPISGDNHLSQIIKRLRPV